MERFNQLPKTEGCLAEGAPVDRWFYRVERPSRSVPRERREPQAGPASCLSNSASKEFNASGEAVNEDEPKTETPARGEGVEGLPGSQSVARAEGVARNRGGPESPCRTNCEGQAGRAAQRQEAPSDTPGVGSPHSSAGQLRSVGADRREGGDTRIPLHRKPNPYERRSKLGQPPWGTRPARSCEEPGAENRPPGSVRGAPGNRCPYLDGISHW